MGSTSYKKPTALILEAPGAVCPICGIRSYSRSGIHPQCAELQADAPRRERLKAQKEPKAAKAKKRSWEKKCPKCGAQVHVRKSICACGHGFLSKW